MLRSLRILLAVIDLVQIRLLGDTSTGLRRDLTDLTVGAIPLVLQVLLASLLPASAELLRLLPIFIAEETELAKGTHV